MAVFAVGMSVTVRCLAVCAVLALPLQAAAQAHEDDPWESFNRSMFAFNETLDTYALKPLAKGYRTVTPDFLETGIGNVFSNVGEVRNLTNNLLQGKLHAAGVPLLAGTDTPAGVDVTPGISLHLELQRFVDAGLTPLDALQTATINPARFLGKTSDFGSVERGRIADLLILRANPLENIADTLKVRTTIKNGRVYKVEDLLKGAMPAPTTTTASR